MLENSRVSEIGFTSTNEVIEKSRTASTAQVTIAEHKSSASIWRPVTRLQTRQQQRVQSEPTTPLPLPTVDFDTPVVSKSKVPVVKNLRVPKSRIANNSLTFDDYTAIDFSVHDTFPVSSNNFLSLYAPRKLQKKLAFNNTSQAPFNESLDTAAVTTFLARLEDFTQKLLEDLHDPSHKPQNVRPSTELGTFRAAQIEYDLRNTIPDKDY